MTADLSSMEAAYKGKYGYELRVTQTFEQVTLPLALAQTLTP